VASWSSIDYYGNWKALHYRAQALFADNVDLNKWKQYYNVYPKDRTYPAPRYTVSVDGSSAALKVNITAQTDLYDLYIDTDPHIDGHFSQNFFDLKAGETVITFFYPADSQADVSRVKIKVKTLNEVMRR
jgi:beta-mannosidase